MEWHKHKLKEVICRLLGHKMERTGWGHTGELEYYHGHCKRCGYEVSKILPKKY